MHHPLRFYRGGEFVVDEAMGMKQVCTGSYMDGIDIDVFDYCGLSELTDEEQDRVWEETNALDLFWGCCSAQVDEQDEDEIEQVTNYTDREYIVSTNNEESLKAELKAAIEKYVYRSN